jgi:NAD(P)H-flavin reductase
VESPDEFHWLPGQYVQLFSLEAPAERFAYSVASAERSAFPGRFELAVRRDGSAKAVERLRVGETIGVGAPRGSFVRLGTNPAPAVFIGIGTGVAPLRAMIQSALAEKNSAELFLLLGCRSEADVPWDRELAELGASGQLSFLPTLSQPSAEWTGRRGYVQAHLVELREPLLRSDVYICGSKALVKDVGARLQDLGVPSERLSVEGY